MKCLSVEYIDESFDLCDLEIDGGTNNYVAEGIVVHNTWCAAGIVPELEHPEIEDGKFVVSSKGLSGQGLAFKFNEQNANNVYLKAFWSIKNVLQSISDDLGTVYILGEIFGPIQDLRYGFLTPQFRVFDIYVGRPTMGYYLDMLTVINICNKYGLQHVPVLYRGPFTREILKQYTDGKETVSGLSQHIREGVVINVVPERFHPKLGRVVVKSVSEDYLTRKNKDATEFQ